MSAAQKHGKDMKNMIFDTHAHYDDEQFDIDREALDGQIDIKFYINMMSRDTQFGIVPDLTQAKLTR